MTLDGFGVIGCFILSVVCYIGYRHASENMYLKYKEQRVGPSKIKEGTN